MISMETLIAYADGELDESARTEVERALRDDPELRKQLDAHRALRQRLQNAFAPVLEDPVPQRLQAALHGGAVVDFAAAKAKRRSLIMQASALAAAFLAGVILNAGLTQNGGDPFYETRDGIYARGALQEALETRLAAAPADEVRIGLSFRDQAGAACRTFAAGNDEGLACREGQDWRIDVLQRGAPQSEMRMANSPALLMAVEDRIAGAPFDAAAERDARDRGWDLD